MRNDFAHVYMDGEYAHRFPDHHHKRRHILDEDGSVLPGSKAYRDTHFGWREGHNVHYRLVSRFLTSRVGRLWDDVLSEACTVLRGSRLRHEIVYDLNRSYTVERGCIMVDGKVCDTIGRPVNGLYVHPETGILCETPKESRNHGWGTRMRLKEFLDPERISLTDADVIGVVEIVEGEWFVRTWQQIEIPRRYDTKTVYYRTARWKRQLSRKDIARLRLREWASLAVELKDGIEGRRYDKAILKRMEAIRDAAIKHFDVGPSSRKG